MPLLIVILVGLLLPRIALLICWCAGVFTGVWTTIFWPLLGFLFLPYTTLAYGLAHVMGSGVEGLWMIIVALALLVDLGVVGGSANKRRWRLVRT